MTLCCFFTHSHLQINHVEQAMMQEDNLMYHWRKPIAPPMKCYVKWIESGALPDTKHVTVSCKLPRR